MTSGEHFPEWFRGYVFATANNPGAMAKQIIEYNKNLQNKDQGFIIRADTIEGDSPYNLVISFNANQGRFDDLENEIIAELDGEPAVRAKLVNYQPYPPHMTAGYVSSAEFGKGNPIRNPGTQDHNVWG